MNTVVEVLLEDQATHMLHKRSVSSYHKYINLIYNWYLQEKERLYQVYVESRRDPAASDFTLLPFPNAMDHKIRIYIIQAFNTFKVYSERWIEDTVQKCFLRTTSHEKVLKIMFGSADGLQHTVNRTAGCWNENFYI